ncbi:MAG TPA: nitroreductase family deazaflavin-dependent oxidoreductase [Thermomicrobiales bacterium]|nr:nitroreductase family deazaflavin-dependent oxidoreductase [Thermomicrobiales bacterium]
MDQSEPRMTREPASQLQRLFLRGPALMYHGPLAELFRWRCVMLLTTTGRKTGQPRTTAVSFMPDGDRYIVFSGWGTSSNWYRNVRASPRVRIKVGRRMMAADARLIEDPDERVALMRRMRDRSGSCGPPKLMRELLRRSGLFDYDAEIRMAIDAGADIPVLELVPARDAGN